MAAATPLAFFRARSGRSQSAVAAEVGISQPYLAQLETGKREGTTSTMARLARLLNVRLDDLVYEPAADTAPSADDDEGSI